MTDYLTFGTGLLVASLFWFAFFTFTLMTYSVRLYDGLQVHLVKVRKNLEIAQTNAKDEFTVIALRRLRQNLDDMLEEDA